MIKDHNHMTTHYLDFALRRECKANLLLLDNL